MGILAAISYPLEHFHQYLEKVKSLGQIHLLPTLFLNVLENLYFEMFEHRSLYDVKLQSLMFLIVAER